MDPYKHLHMSLNPDGSITRNYPVPFTAPTTTTTTTTVDVDSPTLSKDIPLNPTHNTSLRIFIPNNYKPLSHPNHTTTTTLPIILYFHAGGFILCSPSIAPIHTFTSHISSHLPAIILSIDHRLAPEHRLPAAYDDALDALLWLRNQSLLPKHTRDPWLEYANFSRCFLMGSSSGGNIAYHLALRSVAIDLGPTRIVGLIMDQPFFGGEERTESEVRMAEDSVVPLVVTDLMWEMALPVGATRDHEYSKPVPRGGRVMMKGMRCLVRGYLGDPLIDRMRMVAEMMEEEGVEVVSMLEEEGYHGVELYNSSKAQQMMMDLRNFVYNNHNDDDDEDLVVGVSNAPKCCEQQCDQTMETVEVM